MITSMVCMRGENRSIKRAPRELVAITEVKIETACIRPCSWWPPIRPTARTLANHPSYLPASDCWTFPLHREFLQLLWSFGIYGSSSDNRARVYTAYVLIMFRDSLLIPVQNRSSLRRVYKWFSWNNDDWVRSWVFKFKTSARSKLVLLGMELPRASRLIATRLNHRSKDTGWIKAVGKLDP